MNGMNLTAQTRYREALKNIPAPGTGCHPTLLSVANHGARAGVEPQAIYTDIRNSIPEGSRRIPDKEIQDAIDKAMLDYTGGAFTPRPRPEPAVQDGKSALQKIIGQGKIHDEVDLWAISPIRFWDEPKDDPVLFLSTLYKPTDLIFIGEGPQLGIIGETIRSVSDWISYFQNGGKTAPHIIINPLTGNPAPKKNGGDTFRGDGNVVSYRYCLAEFDEISREDQIRFWSAVKLPVCALIDTGGRSIHGFLDMKTLSIKDEAEWEQQIKTALYDQRLVPLGVDPACKNPARLSRLPGHFRAETGKFQRLLWLSREGRSISK